MRGPRADGRWYWRAGTYDAGRERTIWTGWGTAHEADTAVAEIIARDQLHEPRQPDRADTVRDLLEFYLARQEDRADLKPITVSALTTMLRRVVKSMGDVRLERLDSATLERHRDARLRAGSAPSSVRAELVRLIAAWTWGQEVDLVPMRRLSLPATRRAPVYNRRTPERAEVRAVLAQLDGWQHAIVALYASTGARLGELATLEWSAVDVARSTVRVSGKTGPREIPLSPAALAHLDTWRAQGAGEGRMWGVRPSTVRAKLWTSLARACDAAGVPRFSAQGLRRAVVDALYSSGTDIGTAAAILGHSPAVALAAYRQATHEQLAEAVDLARLGDMVEASDRAPVRRRRSKAPATPASSGSTKPFKERP